MPADIVIQLVADTMAACERTMIQGDAQFLLCHHHPAASTTLEAGQFLSVPVGADVLLPVSAPIEPGSSKPGSSLARHSLPGTPEAPVTHLAYRTESGMGRITASALAADGSPVWLKPVFSSHLATLLVTMAIEGRGISWSPKSLVSEALASGTLVRAGNSAWDIPMEIRLLRSRARQSPAAERFWALVKDGEIRNNLILSSI
jgi:DNA-binding transcriptional LysR family regulator